MSVWSTPLRWLKLYSMWQCSETPLGDYVSPSSVGALSSTDTSESETSSTTESSDDEGSCSDDLSSSCDEVHLSPQMLSLLAEGDATDKSTWSLYAKNGANKSRIKEVIRFGGKCRCQRECVKQFTLKRLLAICTMFWSLKKPMQDTVLWSMQTTHDLSESSDSDDSNQ